jgi:hypothetical protein
MNLDVDYLIDFFDKLSSRESKEEMGEQDAAAAPSSGGGGSTSNVPKWADSYPTQRGPANMLGKAGEKWDSGVSRTGPANKIW